jgi:hypothetical protein
VNDYYVYQWVDHDLGQPFYVGKGRDQRMNSMRNRSSRFKAYLAEHPNCSPEIVVDGLTEDEAYDAEREYIAECRSNGVPLVNIAYGGRGGIHLFGKDNPMSGRPWYTDETPAERIAEWRRKIGRSGELNPMWGVSPSERMDVETYQQWRDAHRRITGEKNPNYGNHALSEFYKEHPEIAKARQGRPGAANGRCRPIRAIKPDGSSTEYAYMTLCATDIGQELGVTSVQYLATKISECAKAGRAYKGYHFEFV